MTCSSVCEVNVALWVTLKYFRPFLPSLLCELLILQWLNVFNPI